MAKTMTDKERLTNIIHNAQNKYLNLLKFESSILADYLIANGVIVPPCKVGDRVYRPSKYLGVVQFVITSFNMYQSEMFFTDDSDNIIYLPDIGKTVFLTREEAEKALERSKGNA